MWKSRGAEFIIAALALLTAALLLAALFDYLDWIAAGTLIVGVAAFAAVVSIFSQRDMERKRNGI